VSVYLDNNATTPLDPRVREAMEPWLTIKYGNASSHDHRWGWDAAEAVEHARHAVAAAAHVRSASVIFVSGATEAINCVLRGYVGFAGWERKRIVTSAVEHDAVLSTCRHLSRHTGVSLSVLGVDRAGRLELEAVRQALEPTRGALVAVMAANNEVGTVYPTRPIADLVHAAGGMLLCDTTQAFGKQQVDLRRDGIDFATLSSHKVYGPQGIGALLVRDGLEDSVIPLILGGGQERGARGGTLNVPAIVGFGRACEVLAEHLDEDIAHLTRLRDRLEATLLTEIAGAWVNGDRAHRLCNTSNMGFAGVDARWLVRDLHEVAVSMRSACSSGAPGPSHVLTALGLSDQEAFSSIRFSVGRFTTEEEVDEAAAKVARAAHKLRTPKSA